MNLSISLLGHGGCMQAFNPPLCTLVIQVSIREWMDGWDIETIGAIGE